MPRFKQLAQIQQLMSNKEAIRNLGIIAHIDHGKTTLADSLLAGAGLLSPVMAGYARVLDYLEEEQKRKITIKTANISLLYKAEGNSYLVNLVDTPGHVDFTGKVTRALRAIDGAVVVVDVVEGIMAQTEIVTRQALEERVRPVLFVNKVDRLITELQLNAEQIQKKLDQLINRFNDLIELYGETQFKSQWKIDPAVGNVAFGSALHGWGFTLNIAKQKKVKFQEIIDAYLKAEQDQLMKALPVYKAIFEMAINWVPNPKQAQAYRIEKIWDGHADSAVGRSLAECNDDGSTVMCVTNVQAKQDGGCVAAGRVFSGTVKKDDKLYLVDALAETQVNQVSIDMGSFREEVNWVSAGNLASLSLPVMVKAGETLVDLAHKAGMVPFESINYVSEPVVTLAVEPKNPKDIPILLDALEKLASEDPNLKVSADKQTGEYLLSGMGELHLEIAVNQLKSAYALKTAVSSPRVVYVESVTKKGTVALSKSPNKQNSFNIQVEPEEEEITRRAGEDKVKETGSILSFDEYRNVLVDSSGKTQQTSEEVLESIIAGFEFACKAGPLCGEPLRHVKVNLIDLQLSDNMELCNSVEVMHGIGKAIFASFLTAKPVLLEPIYKTVISTPTELAGECQRILSTRRGKTTSFEQKGLLSIIKGFIPVAETFGFSKELRSATSGRAFWQSIFDHWEKLSEKNAAKIIEETRLRKGLPSEVPKPERFLE
jgi:elongation factor 2